MTPLQNPDYPSRTGSDVSRRYNSDSDTGEHSASWEQFRKDTTSGNSTGNSLSTASSRLLDRLSRPPVQRHRRRGQASSSRSSGTYQHVDQTGSTGSPLSSRTDGSDRRAISFQGEENPDHQSSTGSDLSSRNNASFDTGDERRSTGVQIYAGTSSGTSTGISKWRPLVSSHVPSSGSSISSTDTESFSQHGHSRHRPVVCLIITLVIFACAVGITLTVKSLQTVVTGAYRLTKKNYTSDLKNLSSDTARQLASEFCSGVEETFTENPKMSYEGCHVTKFSKGSVITDFKLRFGTTFDDNTELKNTLDTASGLQSFGPTLGGITVQKSTTTSTASMSDVATDYSTELFTSPTDVPSLTTTPAVGMSDVATDYSTELFTSPTDVPSPTTTPAVGMSDVATDYSTELFTSPTDVPSPTTTPAVGMSDVQQIIRQNCSQAQQMYRHKRQTPAVGMSDVATDYSTELFTSPTDVPSQTTTPAVGMSDVQQIIRQNCSQAQQMYRHQRQHQQSACQM
ncbi:hypothetical protein NP493_312g10006 [Ridgeia piscesae]|uniref:SEA domain-containing protein n=1 Tax=Ridgeia piscesae TaxID=27915 RepID=A0AAD9NWF0_RIDPI|nr:hypothetical protein NP493_312g10006 [Ridgeia piscesae]